MDGRLLVGHRRAAFWREPGAPRLRLDRFLLAGCPAAMRAAGPICSLIRLQEIPVAANCDVCGKGPCFGHSISHSHRRTKRRWNPNIQRVQALVGAAA